MYGRNYCPIAYVIWPDKPTGWNPAVDAVNDYERLMYQLPLNGIAFERDNETVFSFIQLAVVHSQAETWIYNHVPGRMAVGQCKPSAIIMKVKQNWTCRRRKPSRSWTPWYTQT